MNLPELAIRRPVAAWMLMAALVFFGILCLFSLGVSRLPDVTYPVLTVVAQWPGASPEVMEAEVVDPLEEVLMSVQGIQDVTTTVMQGVARIQLDFRLDRDIDAALQETNSKIRSVQLPYNVDPPVIFKVNQNDSPILWLAVTWDRPLKDIIRYVDTRVRDKFSLVQGIGDIQLGGWTDRNFRIWLDRNKLAQYQVAPNDVLNLFRAEYQETASGYLESANNEINVRVMGEVASPEEMGGLALNHRGGSGGANLPPLTGIASAQGGMAGTAGTTSFATNTLSNVRGPADSFTPLAQIARVEDGIMDPRRFARSDGVPSVGLGLQKLRGYNEIEVANSAKRIMEEIKPDLPPGMKIGTRFDSSVFTAEAIRETAFTLLFSIGVTTLVCLAFLGSFRTTVNVLFSIPISILGSFIFCKAMGFTLNFFTLLALSMAVGIVIDDSIMVLENITRHHRLGKSPEQSALDGTREIFFAAAAATLTIVSVFAPIAFLGGVVGKFLFQFGAMISCAVLISLLEALTLAPMRCAEFVSGSHGPGRVEIWLEGFYHKMGRVYRVFLGFALRHRWLVVLVSFGLFFLSLRVFPLLHRELAPSEDLGMALLRIETPVGSSLDYTTHRVQELESFLKRQPTVAHFFTTVGGYSGGEVNRGAIFVTLKPRKERKERLQEIIRSWRKELGKPAYSDLHIKVIDISQSAFSSKRGTNIELSLRGSDYAVLQAKADAIVHQMEATGFYTDLDTDYRTGMPELEVIPDRQKAADSNISMQTIADVVAAGIGGMRQGQYTNREDNRRYDLRIRLEPNQWREPEDVANLPLWSGYGGEMIRLKDIAEVRVVPKLLDITRENRRRAITLYANVKPEVSQAKALDTALEICRKELPPGYDVEPTGSSQTAKETFASFPVTFALGLLLAYMLLGAQFNSFLYPLVVLVAIPFSLTGAFQGLYLTGMSLNIYSGIGIILLMGLAMKNSILLVEFFNKKRFEEALPLPEALLDAATIRLRPILMTSLATIAAALPGAVGFGPGAEVRKPLAIVVISGIIVSTFFTLFVVPCVYSLLAPLSRRKRLDEVEAELAKSPI
ncbi:MAG: efflux RND transporter permease subunit [Methylacidiphilaceae bacterium]|nr:efflux RND transporter permease subunit [Candidatus Methylacidiphilaceae bacterium]